MEDNIIIKEVLNGAKNQYNLLMDKYYNEIFKYVYNLIGDYEETFDLLQQIFLKIYKILKKYNSEKASFRTWMYRIVSNETINYLKSSSYKLNHNNEELNEEILSINENPESITIKDELINQVLDSMDKVLSKKHKEILQLYYFSNLSVKEINEVTDIPIKTIYKALESSLTKLRRELNNE